MKPRFTFLLVASGAAMVLPTISHAQFLNGGRWGQEEKRSLCRQSIALAGVEDDMYQKIRGIVRSAGGPAGGSRGWDTSSRAFQDALDDTLNDAKGPILDQLL